MSGPVPPRITPAQRNYLDVFDSWMRAGAEDAPDFMHDRREAAAGLVAPRAAGTDMNGTLRLLRAIGVRIEREQLELDQAERDAAA